MRHSAGDQRPTRLSSHSRQRCRLHPCSSCRTSPRHSLSSATPRAPASAPSSHVASALRFHDRARGYRARRVRARAHRSRAGGAPLAGIFVGTHVHCMDELLQPQVPARPTPLHHPATSLGKQANGVRFHGVRRAVNVVATRSHRGSEDATAARRYLRALPSVNRSAPGSRDGHRPVRSPRQDP